MERSSKRGKIPQRDWPLIIQRYENGETLAAIARSYDCSPPAISYILSRSRGRDAAVDSVVQSAIEPSQPILAEPQTDRAAASVGRSNPDIPGTAPHVLDAQVSIPVELASGDPPEVELAYTRSEQIEPAGGSADAIAANHSAHGHSGTRHSLEPPREGRPLSSDVGQASGSLQDGEPRRTLHLSSPQRSNRPDPQPHATRTANASESAAIRPEGAHQQGSALQLPPERPRADYYGLSNITETIRGAAEPSTAKDGGAFVDRALRQRVHEDISTFLAAFDAALANDSLESRAGLREATDRLLRAGARTRIELERLEARVPLSGRRDSGQPVSPWRTR